MTGKELIDPFDDPATLANMGSAPAAPKPAAQGGLIDPFDDPAFLDRANAERLQSRVGSVLQQEFGPQQPRQRAKTLQDRGREVFGFEDLESRGSILPIGRREEGGPIEPAVPGFLKDMAEKLLLPGHAAEGGAYTADDALGFTLDFAVPGSQGRAPVKRSDFVREAPSAEQLKTEGLRFKAEAGASGVKVKPESFLDFVADIETTVRLNELDPDLHPGATAAFRRLSNAVGQEPDLDRIQTFRRLIGQAQRSTKDELEDDRRIAGMMQRALDEYVESLKPGDLLEGDPTRAGENLRKFRSLYSRSKKSEDIDDIISKAELQQSGFENGIKIGFKALLNKKGGTKGFSKEEIAVMRQIAKGGASGQQLMRLLGKLSFEKKGATNIVGGSIGMTAGGTFGGAVGGPLGTALGLAATPAVAGIAQKGAEKAALDNALLARAMAATGRSAPKDGLSINTLRNLLERSGGPVVNSLAPQLDPYDPGIL